MTTNTMLGVPEWARVSKSEFVRLRNELRRTCDAAAFDFRGVWNLMVEQMEERHALVAKGKRKTELTLAKAVAQMQKDIIKERADIMQEQATSVEFIDGQPTGNEEMIA